MTPAAGEHAGAILGSCRWGLGTARFLNPHHQNTFLTIFVGVNPFVGVIFRRSVSRIKCTCGRRPRHTASAAGAEQQRVGNAPPWRGSAV
jgi:hypothetical protein